MTPGAAERATLQENGGADSRPVVEGKLLYIENQTRIIHAFVEAK
jgi:hypothetical protein